MTTWTPIPKYSQGSNLVVNGNFADASGWVVGANWVLGSGLAQHSAGSTDPINQDLITPITAGELFSVQLTISGMTAGSIEVALDTSTVTFTESANGTYLLTFTADGIGTDTNIVLTPTTDFDGALSNVSVSPAVPTSWTTIPAPTGTVTTMFGAAYGLLLAITQPKSVTTDNWTRIGAPATSWTTIPKAI